MSRPLYIVRQSAYTLFSFCCFLVLALVLTLIGFILITVGGSTDEHKRRYHRILQRMSRFVIHRVPGTSFVCHNPQRETFDVPSMIVCNHQSHLDLMAILMLTPNIIILTKNWVWHNPFYGMIIRYADFMPITDTDQMAVTLAEKVGKGYSIMIFPEGTRSADCHIQRFHRGAFFLAEQLGLDIVPLYINGFGEVLPKTSFHLHPGKMSLEVMPRISRQGAPGYREMTKQVHQLYVTKHTFQRPSKELIIDN